MCHPKFEVGEIVVLQSAAHPELNGEYPVEDIFLPDELKTINGQIFRTGGAMAYLLPVTHALGHGWWDESALRKRHTPVEYSFDALKHILSMPVDKRDFA